MRIVDQPPLRGRLVYRDAEDSIDMDLDDPHAVDSELLMQYLSISADSTNGTISSIWGYSPRQSWAPATLRRPSAVRAARLALVDPTFLHEGAGRELHPDDEWQCLFDQGSQILEVRLRHSSVSAWFGVAVGTRVGLDDEDCIVALQPEPEFV